MTEAQNYDLYGVYEELPMPCPRCNWAKPNYYRGVIYSYTVNSDCQCKLLYPTLLEVVATADSHTDYDF